jgi:hypothetical protein
LFTLVFKSFKILKNFIAKIPEILTGFANGCREKGIWQIIKNRRDSGRDFACLKRP